MSVFLDNFKSFFSTEERESEIYKIMSMIGINTEKAIKEELDAEVRRSSEAIAFTEQKLRSWLAFFLMPIRNIISATGYGKVIVESIAGSSLSTVVIPAGSIVTGSNGKEYQIQENLLLDGVGSSAFFTFIQGVSSTFTTTYSEFTAIPIETGNVDLSYIRVFIGDIEVPLAPPFPNFPINLTEFLGSLSNLMSDLFSNAILEESEKTIFIQNEITRLFDALWEAVQGVSVRPFKGFFPFFFDNTLFVKVFPGGSPSDVDFVPDPNGQQLTVHYRVSDGVYGNIGKNQLVSFTHSIQTEDGGLVEVSLLNEVVSNGVNPPSQAELVNLLRRRFYASTHVSSVPEYTTWFLSQPGIGDCLVVSDYERWRISRNKSFSGFDVKGTVEVYLLDNFGNVIIPRDATNSFTPFMESLDQRLEAVRDIAFLDYRVPSVFWHYFVIQYISVFNEPSFVESIGNVISTLYTVDWAQLNRSSLFKDINLDIITNALKEDFNPTGLRVIPYHYYEYRNDLYDESFLWVRFSHYENERPGGWYEYWEFDDPVNPQKLGYYDVGGVFCEGSPRSVFREFISVSGDVSIHKYVRNPIYINSEFNGWDWSSLDNSNVDSNIGRRVGGDIFINLAGFRPGVLRCFWAVEYEGTIPVGGGILTNLGIRKLPVKTDGFSNKSEFNTYFGGSFHFEKYV